jgi:hypothetical protein
MMLITTVFVSFLVFCRLEVRCGWAGVVSGLQAEALDNILICCICGRTGGFKIAPFSDLLGRLRLI